MKTQARASLGAAARRTRPDRDALSALEHQLDYMGSGGDRQVAILQRAARRALGHPESPILDKIIGESGET